MMDKNFSRVQTNIKIKINVSGRWANLINCDVDDYDAVKAACETLARVHRGWLRFKALDAGGDVIEEYGLVQEILNYCWHVPARREAVR